MDQITEKIIELLECECEVIAPQPNANLVMKAYEQAKEEGKEQGFYPVLLVPNEDILERLKSSKGVEAYLTEYKKHQGKDILSGYLQELRLCLEKQGEPWEEVLSTVERGQPVDEYIGFIPEEWDMTFEVILAKVPTTRPWEVFAWIPVGGWNECPPTEYMIAVMKEWYESYGFETVVITSDMIEGAPDHRPQTAEEAMEIATNQYAFCPDLVEQCCGDATIGQLADTLLQSDVWFFWWD